MADYDGFYTYKGHIVTIDLHEEEDCVKHWVEVTDPYGHTISPDVTPYGPSEALINKMIDAYIALKREEIEKLNMSTHPVEFGMYYSC